jgi:hypothetical protein
MLPYLRMCASKYTHAQKQTNHVVVMSEFPLASTCKLDATCPDSRIAPAHMLVYHVLFTRTYTHDIGVDNQRLLLVASYI